LTGDSLVLNINADVKNIRLVRRLLRTFLSFKDIDEDEIFKLELAINEALANVVEHTYKFDPSKRIIVGLSFEGDQIHITLRDFGEKINFSEIEANLPSDPLSENGRGVYIIKNIVDEFRFDDRVKEGNLLHLKKTLKKSTP